MLILVESPTLRFLVQKRQYIEHWLVVRKRTRSGYRCTMLGTGTVGVLGERILGEPVFVELLAVRDALEPDGIAGITDQAEVVRIDADVEQLVQPFGQFLVEPEPLHQILGSCRRSAATSPARVPSCLLSSCMMTRYLPYTTRSSPGR